MTGRDQNHIVSFGTFMFCYSLYVFVFFCSPTWFHVIGGFGERQHCSGAPALLLSKYFPISDTIHCWTLVFIIWARIITGALSSEGLLFVWLLSSLVFHLPYLVLSWHWVVRRLLFIVGGQTYFYLLAGSAPKSSKSLHCHQQRHPTTLELHRGKP